MGPSSHAAGWATRVALVAWAVTILAPARGATQTPPEPPPETSPVPSEEGAPTPPSEQTSTPSQEGEELSEEELKLLHDSIAADQAEQAEATPPPFTTAGPAPVTGSFLDIAVILDAAAAWFSEEPLQLGGHDPNRNGFTLQQIELSLAANVDPFLRFDAFIVFIEVGVEVEEAYATTLDLPASLQMRAGQFLTRFGRTNATHPHTWHFVDQPLANGVFLGGEGNRGLGVEASWLTPLPWFVELVASTTTAEAEAGEEETDAVATDPHDHGHGGGDVELIHTAAIKQFFELGSALALAWGLSGQLGSHADDAQLYGTDLYLRYRPLDSDTRTAVSLTTEVMVRRQRMEDQVFSDLGLHSELVFNIDPRWEVGARYGLWSAVDGQGRDPDQGRRRQRVDAQFTFYPSHFSRLRLQGGWDAPDHYDHPIWKAMLALEVLTGAHGAHAY